MGPAQNFSSSVAEKFGLALFRLLSLLLYDMGCLLTDQLESKHKKLANF
jgi:hypothetical protein